MTDANVVLMVVLCLPVCTADKGKRIVWSLSVKKLVSPPVRNFLPLDQMKGYVISLYMFIYIKKYPQFKNNALFPLLCPHTWKRHISRPQCCDLISHGMQHMNPQIPQCNGVKCTISGKIAGTWKVSKDKGCKLKEAATVWVLYMNNMVYFNLSCIVSSKKLQNPQEGSSTTLNRVSFIIFI